MSIRIVRVTGLAMIQDSGRRGHRAAGVPIGGAMDTTSLARANSLVGNEPGMAAIEWAVAGGSIAVTEPALVATAGADVELSLAGTPVPACTAIHVTPDQELTIGRFRHGAFLYVAIAGGFDVPVVLGSRSTYLPAAIGGHEGRRLRAGDVLHSGAARSGSTSSSEPASSRHERRREDRIRVVEGPDAAAFSATFRADFWSSVFSVSRASDRAGYRLIREGSEEPHSSSSASEPACVGTIQVPRGDSAIVLMPDGPTAGGYPKIGVVAAVDLPRLAQRTPGETVQFELITLQEAQRLLLADGVLAGIAACG